MSLRCVLADDHPALLQAVREYLDGEGVAVAATASDGQSALDAIAREQPDVAVVDLRMPRLGGLALLDRIRAVAPSTRVVVYTAEADGTVVRKTLSAGAVGIVLKEAPLPDLLRALDAAATGSTYVDSALSPLHRTVDRTILTERERAVLQLLTDGLTHHEIGERLSISAETVRTHVQKASVRLGAANKTQAVATALRMGLIA